MQNTSTRPFPSRDPRDRLVYYLNSTRQKRGPARIEAIALEATSRAGAEAEATGRHCEYVVFTTLLSLQAVDRPGEIRAGIDPVPQPPGPPYQHAPTYVAVMSFELLRGGEPVMQSTVRSVQRITADDMVLVLMRQVADRVSNRIAKAP